MEAEALREAVQRYIDGADERLLKMIKALVESYEEDKTKDFPLNEEHYKEIDRRREEYLADPEEAYSWEEVKKIIKNASKK